LLNGKLETMGRLSISYNCVRISYICIEEELHVPIRDNIINDINTEV